jgi:hypothetical protein
MRVNRHAADGVDGEMRGIAAASAVSAVPMPMPGMFMRSVAFGMVVRMPAAAR